MKVWILWNSKGSKVHLPRVQRYICRGFKGTLPRVQRYIVEGSKVHLPWYLTGEGNHYELILRDIFGREQPGICKCIYNMTVIYIHLGPQIK